MIITRRWLEEFINISNISTDEICKTLNSIGLEVDSVEKKSIASKVVVAKVLSKEKHPDADKLNVCQVDLGDEVTQIVCGASNVETGQTVAVATIGAILENDFKIKAAKLRGVESNGMLLAAGDYDVVKLLTLDNNKGSLENGSNNIIVNYNQIVYNQVGDVISKIPTIQGFSPENIEDWESLESNEILRPYKVFYWEGIDKPE